MHVPYVQVWKKMMNMMSATPASTTQHLENSIAKINAEVETLQADFNKVSEDVGAIISGKAAKTKIRVPLELKVYHRVYRLYK